MGRESEEEEAGAADLTPTLTLLAPLPSELLTLTRVRLNPKRRLSQGCFLLFTWMTRGSCKSPTHLPDGSDGVSPASSGENGDQVLKQRKGTRNGSQGMAYGAWSTAGFAGRSGKDPGFQTRTALVHQGTRIPQMLTSPSTPGWILEISLTGSISSYKCCLLCCGQWPARLPGS